MPDFEQLALASMGYDPDRRPIPEDERRDASVELLSQLFAGGLRLPDPGAVEEALPYFVKASVLEPSFEQFTIGTRQTPTHTAVLMLNEYGLVEQAKQSRWLEKSHISGFRFLRDIVAGTDLLQAIIRTRVRQVLTFLVPEREEGASGFRIARTDGEKPEKGEKKALRELEAFVLASGDESDHCRRERLRRDDLEGFATKVIWDTLTADACPIELVRTTAGKITGYHALDFATIRLCSEAGYEGDDQVRAVQLIDATPYATFTYNDLLYPVRNPRTDIRAGGYGYAEVEAMVRAITGYLDSITYNQGGISRSAVPRGILTVFGEYDQPQQRSFTHSWRSMLSGAGNRHVIPTMFSKSKEGGATWTPIDQFNEMFFARWITLLVSIASAMFGIDPGEINFDSFSTRTSSLGGRGDTAEKLAHSYDKGLIPLLRHLEKILAQLVELRSGGEYTFRFVGVEQDDPDKKHELLKLASTIDEIRERNGQEPHPDETLGAAPANPSLMGIYMQKVQAEMGGGDPNEDGDGEPADGDEGEDYPTDKLGRHAPYPTNPNGGDPEVPEEEHLHTLSFGKAVPPPSPRRRRPFRAIVVREESWDAG